MRLRFRWMDGSVNFVHVNGEEPATVKGVSTVDHVLLPWKELASLTLEDEPDAAHKADLERAYQSGLYWRRRTDRANRWRRVRRLLGMLGITSRAGEP